MRCCFDSVRCAVQECRYQDAIALLSSLLDAVPEHIEARIQRAKLYAVVGQWQGAIDDFQIVLTADPSDTEAHLNLASIFTLLNHFESAADHFRNVGSFSRPYSVEIPAVQSAYGN